MSLLAALAKGFGAGTVDNARTGFAEQQRQREAAQRKEEMGIEIDASTANLQAQIDAGKASDDARFKAAADENQKNRDHDWALFEKKLAVEMQTAATNASARARESYAKNIIGTLEQVSKRKIDILSDDKLTDEQRALAARESDMVFYTMVSDPGAQKLLGEFGYGGYIQHGLSLAPPPPEPAPDAPDSLRRPPEVHAPMRRPGSDGPNAQPSKAFSAEQLGGVLGKAQQQAKANMEDQRRAQLQGRSGSYMGVGYDPQNRAPVNVTAGKPLRLTSEFSLPSNDAYVPPYARYPK